MKRLPILVIHIPFLLIDRHWVILEGVGCNWMVLDYWESLEALCVVVAVAWLGLSKRITHAPGIISCSIKTRENYGNYKQTSNTKKNTNN